MDENLIPQETAPARAGNVENNRYHGETKDGVRHGTGTYSYPMGGREMFMYDGNWDAGVKKGHGVLSIAGLSKYEGEFDSTGEITGYGKRT
jgi:hypothetical protein